MEESVLDEILDKENIKLALKAVKKRNGCAGSDGMKVSQLSDFWDKYGNAISEMIRNGNYTPAPAKRIYIKKPGKAEKRKLAIPTVLDRMLENAILQVLTKYYEKQFHRNSYGFRKRKNGFMALRKCIKLFNKGYIYIADLDIEKFFDCVNHKIVLDLLRKDFNDEYFLKLIKKYIKMEIGTGKIYQQQKKGVIQGGPLSPLLANVVLNQLDWHLDKNGFQFIRYADDIIILCKTEEEAKQALAEAEDFLSANLRLYLNQTKTKVVTADDLEYIGYGFKKDETDKYVLALNEKTKEKMYQNMQKIINKQFKNSVQWWDRIGSFNRGWINYYSFIASAELNEFLTEAEKHQIALIHEYIETIRNIEKKKELQWTFLDSKQYVLPIQWIEEIERRRRGGQ